MLRVDSIADDKDPSNWSGLMKVALPPPREKNLTTTIKYAIKDREKTAQSKNICLKCVLSDILILTMRFVATNPRKMLAQG